MQDILQKGTVVTDRGPERLRKGDQFIYGILVYTRAVRIFFKRKDADTYVILRSAFRHNTHITTQDKIITWSILEVPYDT